MSGNTDLKQAAIDWVAARAEFEERTGGGIGGKRWLAPLLPVDFAAPVHYGWPEYVTTARGAGWYVPEGA